MDFPKYPRHLSNDERRAVRNEAARAFADETMAKTEAATGPMTDGFKRAGAHDAAVVQGLTMVTLNWHEERLKKLEAEVRAGHERIAQLEGR